MVHIAASAGAFAALLDSGALGGFSVSAFWFSLAFGYFLFFKKALLRDSRVWRGFFFFLQTMAFVRFGWLWGPLGDVIFWMDDGRSIKYLFCLNELFKRVQFYLRNWFSFLFLGSTFDQKIPYDLYFILGFLKTI